MYWYVLRSWRDVRSANEIPPLVTAALLVLLLSIGYFLQPIKRDVP